MSDEEWDPTVAAQPQYKTLDAWMQGWFTGVVRRRLRGGVSWCPSWWAHPEAAARLGALWAAWEQAQVEGGGAPSYWWLYHLDGHWAVLTAPSGPFSACSTDRHTPDPDRLPTRPLPEEATTP